MHVAGYRLLWVVGLSLHRGCPHASARYGDSFRRPARTALRRLPFGDTLDRLLPAPPRPEGLGFSRFLSWSSSKIALPPTSPYASTLGCPRFGVATPEHVPPLSFCPTSAVSSAYSLQVCCTLQPVIGFAWFRAVPPTFAGRTTLLRGVLALRSSSLAQRVSLSPGSLPPRRWSTPTEADAFPDLEDFLRTRVPPVRHCCRRAGAPMGFPRPSFHRGTPLPEAPLVSQCPVHFRTSGFPPRSGRCMSARDAFPLHPCGWSRDACETGTGFPTVSGNPTRRWNPHPPRRSVMGRRPRRAAPVS